MQFVSFSSFTQVCGLWFMVCGFWFACYHPPHSAVTRHLTPLPSPLPAPLPHPRRFLRLFRLHFLLPFHPRNFPFTGRRPAQCPPALPHHIRCTSRPRNMVIIPKFRTPNPKPRTTNPKLQTQPHIPYPEPRFRYLSFMGAVVTFLLPKAFALCIGLVVHERYRLMFEGSAFCGLGFTRVSQANSHSRSLHLRPLQLPHPSKHSRGAVSSPESAQARVSVGAAGQES